MATVSVIVPVYNGAEFVAATIESALAQTCPAEIIAIDDGSTDETARILEGFAPRIRVIHQPNRGLAAARNAGIAAATGEYVALLDADDLWEPTFLEVAAARLATTPAAISGVFAGWAMIDRAGRLLPDTRTVPRGVLGASDFLSHCPFPPSTVALKRDGVLAVGGFDDALCATEDWDLWLRLTRAGGSFAALERCLCRYRVHEHSWSRDPERMRTGGLRTLEKFFADEALPPELRANRAAAFAHVHARASAQFYAVGQDESGASALFDAVRAWPEILLEDETHWAIICAEQPLGYKGSPHFLDLAKGERRVLHALARSTAEAGLDAPLKRRAHGRLYRALAQLAYSQGRMRDVRRYVRRALTADYALSFDRATLATLVKSAAGALAIDTLRRWKRTRMGRGSRA